MTKPVPRRDFAFAAEPARRLKAPGPVRGPIGVLATLPPAPGRIFVAEPEALLLIGPHGAVPASLLMVRTLAPLADVRSVSGERLAEAGRWRKVEEMRATVLAFQPTLAAIGIALLRKEEGWRIVTRKD